ncbi:MAG: FHA domain-containing protein [Bdellovibrio sp.]|nr:FHA domain-containing protein [Bdellovibrio sp.]
MGAAPQIKDALKLAIEVTKGPHAGLKMSFNKAAISLGRGPENDVVLSNDPRASRHHAEIKMRGASEFVIVNLSAKNFILLNGQSVQTELLSDDSVIQIGDTEIRVKIETPVVAPAKPAPAFPLQQHQSQPSPVAPNHRPMTAQNPLPQQPVIQQQAPLPQMPNSALPPTMQQPGMPAYQAPQFKAVPSPGLSPLQNPKVRFYGIIAILVLVGGYLMTASKPVVKDPNAIRTSAMSMQDVANAEKRSQELLTLKREKYDSVQYRRAQENFIKGFRDYQQGQYARAREAFQVVLNLDPDNELAKRYYHLSKIKFDELVKFNMIQGNRYREKKNWRMCQSNYTNVMTMLQYRKDDPSFKEAKQFYEECTLNLEGRF